jgi:peptidoglycan/xylan/chitin deacetylase (PgdA/CDA1 family)
VGRLAATEVDLCFHGIGRPERPLEPGEVRYWVRRDLFERVLDLVTETPGVRLSFDDGNASDVSIALPALKDRGLHATFFLLAGRLDQPGSVATSDVGALTAAGMTVGSHGMDHRPWRGLGGVDVERELDAARRIIESAAGHRVDRAALPLGRYDRRTLGQLRRRGYVSVATSDRRPTRPGAWLRHRFSVRADDSVESVRSMLAPPPVTRTVERAVVGTVKRLR